MLLSATLFGAVLSVPTGAFMANEDPYLWLEDVEAEKSLDWVRARNAENPLAKDPGFETVRSDLLAILDSNARIPYVNKIGEYYYNFWRDKTNPQGIWRRTTLAEFRKDAPKWEVLLDIDALGKAEGTNWVWGGADCLRPEYDRCLINLSRGGADATVTREFDISDRAFVKGGFERPEAKGDLSWIDSRYRVRRHRLRTRLDDQLRLCPHRQAVAARHADVGSQS